MYKFWLCFVPLFVAVDAVGVLPMFINLTEGIDVENKHKIIIQSVITAIIVAIMFIAIGTNILNFLGITVADFMVAGGILLFIFSIKDMLSLKKTQRSVDPECIGAVPIGVPLITGPAVLTTSILLLNQYGFLLTALSLFINILIAGIIFYFSTYIYNFLGKAGAGTISKIASLFLAAIAVMMIRKGIFILISIQ